VVAVQMKGARHGRLFNVQRSSWLHIDRDICKDLRWSRVQALREAMPSFTATRQLPPFDNLAAAASFRPLLTYNFVY
jgi:hypothetical protein